ncbi:MAG: hypothetical protein ACNA7W_04610 [Pseudomonadales bacterium]
MLETLQKVSRPLRRLLPLAVVLGLAGVVVFLWSAATGGSGESDSYLIPGLLAMLWGALLFVLITGFRNVPPPAGPEHAFGMRLRIRFARAGYQIMAWFIIAAGLASLFVTFRLLTLWLG